MLFVVAADERPDAYACGDALAERLHCIGVEILHMEPGDVRPNLAGHEHSGLDDREFPAGMLGAGPRLRRPR